MTAADLDAPPAGPGVAGGCGDDLVAAILRTAAADPDRVAITSGGSTLTGGALDARVRALASVLSGAPGAASEGPVGIAVPHGAQAVLALLGALAAGRAFVPLDPAVPAERLMEFVAAAGVRTVVLGAVADETAAALRSGVPHLVDLGASAPGAGALAAPLQVPGGPACVLFTSGSTGVPKGVVYSRRLLAHDARLGRDLVGITAADRVGVALPYSFSAGLAACLWALTAGAPLHLFDPRRDGAAALPDWADAHCVTTLHTSPSLLRGVVTRIPAHRRMADLRLVTTSGEPLYGRDVRDVRPHLADGATVVNWVGASEIASLAMHRVEAAEPVPAGPVPAGRPVPGKDVRIVRDDGGDAAPGEVGAVEVTSRFLADGYHGDDELTRARFQRHGDGSATFRSGDRGVLHPDGTLELRGRLDAAVKIRGYLVEPAEVENALLGCPGVVEAVVVVDGAHGTAVDGGPAPRLVAYFAADPEARVEPVAVRRHLRGRLPEYMVPTAVVAVGALPRNDRGKVARTALPPVDRPMPGGGRALTPAEAEVAAIWAEVLHVDAIGADDDFFALGGDSLAVVDLVAALARRLGRAATTADLVAAPTLAEFAARCGAAPGAGAPGAGASGRVARPPSPRTVVPLRTTGSLSPLFCVAGAAGLGIVFRKLAARLPDDRPVYGLQGNGVENRVSPGWSVTAIARRHIRSMRAVQPEGPYHVAGHSFGGLVAYEIGRQLTAAGEQVGLVALLDTYLPWADTRYPLADPSTAPRFVRGLSLLARRPADVLRWSVRTLPRIAVVGPVRFAPAHHHRMLYAQAVLVNRTYRLRPYPGPVELFAAEDTVVDAIPCWRRLAGPGLTVHRIEARHHSLLREPAVDTVAGLLAEGMARHERQAP